MNRPLLFLSLVALAPAVVAFKRILPDSPAIPHYGPAPASAARAFDAGPPDAAQLDRGRRVYEMLCQACHMPDGRGMGSALPPLAGADYLFADRERAAHIVLHGLSGPITVNGVGYNAAMPALGGMLSDQQVADVLAYVFNSWGNTGDSFDPHRIRALRGGAVR